MMSKKQLACMLTLHIVYLLVGAAIFYHIESPLEQQQRVEDKLERIEIQNLLYENYIPNDPEKQDNILRKLSQYCGKSMYNYTTEDDEGPYKWDFYHSFFFSYTVVSTIGYGNLAPTTHLSRILMIFYGLFGIPINGILLANLGEYFGLQLISVYRKYKKRNEKRADNLDYFFNNLGMLGQIFLYLIPGFLFFMFLPACIFVLFEGWDYVGAVYYAFVTLTTIGFGDMVAGTVNNGFAEGYYFMYQIFLIIWITFGLGYIVMLLGFITSGMRSERVHRLEQKFANQFKTTQSRILQGFTKDMAVLRKLINEANVIKLKPVYVEAAPRLYRSASCPIFSFDIEPRDGGTIRRKRANSENIHLSAKDMLRIQSDTDLLGIDKEKTFNATAIVKPAELLARVVNVLGGLDTSSNKQGIHMFDDDHILASEQPTLFSIGQNVIQNSTKRHRALSVAVPNYRKESVPKIDHEFTWTNGDTAEKFRIEANKRSGKLSLPANNTPIDGENNSQPRSIFSKFLFRKQSNIDNPTEYIKNTLKGRINSIHGSAENIKEKSRRGSIFPTFFYKEDEKNETDAYKEKTHKGRHSIFPKFDSNRGEDDVAKDYKEKTKRGRHSIFPTFDFSEDENEAAAKAYRKKSKRHSIFPTFDFSDKNDDEELEKSYKDRTKSGRHSIFPTFDFRDPEDDDANIYKERTRQGRHSIFPTFNFTGLSSNSNDDITSESEVQKYKNQTRKGRLSLFPTFGRTKKNDGDDNYPENLSEIHNYHNKTQNGRTSLFPTFGRGSKSSSDEQQNDLESTIKQYQYLTGRGRSSLFSGDLDSYREATNDGRNSLFSSDLEYRGKPRRRPSLFDPDINISNLPESEQVEVLEHTSVADLLRALAVLETAAPQSSRTSDDSTGLLELITDSSSTPPRRRGSLRPDFATPALPSRPDMEHQAGPRRRKISGRSAIPQFTPTLATVVAGAELQTTATAARENRMSMLTQPHQTESVSDNESQQVRTRRFSPAPGGPGRTNTGPIPRLFSRIHKDSVSSIEEADSRRGSLTNIVIDNNKPNT